MRPVWSWSQHQKMYEYEKFEERKKLRREGEERRREGEKK